MESTAHDRQSVALAFAVAALQRGDVLEQMMTPSLYGSFNAPKESFGGENRRSLTGQYSSAYSQPAGSGSQEKTGSLTESRQDEDDEEDDDEDEDAEKRLAKSRERNREHARRTRLRKKAHLEALQSKVKLLEEERQKLKQKMEECSIASILLGLSSDANNESMAHQLLDADKSKADESSVALLTGGRRKRFFSDNEHSIQADPIKVSIDGELTIIGGGCHVNWKTGVYSDDSGTQKQLTSEQLKKLRRERNRMHAKLTRDRKKCFISVLEKTIEDLQEDVNNMRTTLARVSSTSPAESQIITPVMSPEHLPMKGHIDNFDEASMSQCSHDNENERPEKRARHGFSLLH